MSKDCMRSHGSLNSFAEWPQKTIELRKRPVTNECEANHFQSMPFEKERIYKTKTKTIYKMEITEYIYAKCRME